MMHKINTICLVGNDINIFLASLYFLKNNKDIKIFLLETKKEHYDISTKNIASKLFHECGIDHYDFCKNTKSTFKISTSFKKNNKKWSSHFLSINQDVEEHVSNLLKYYYEKYDYKNKEYISRILYNVINLCDYGLFATHYYSFNLLENSGFHLNYNKSLNYLKQLCQQHTNFNYYKPNSVNIHKNNNHIDYILSDDEKIVADLFFDCSGSDFMLMENNDSYVDLSNLLNTNNFINSKQKYTKKSKELKSYTEAYELNSGWSYNVSTYEYNNINFLCDVSNYIPNDNEKIINFKSGYYENSWQGNVIALGKCLYFLEPIESNELSITYEVLSYLSNLMKTDCVTELDSNKYNLYLNEIIKKDIFTTINNHYHYQKNLIYYHTHDYFEIFKKYYIQENYEYIKNNSVLNMSEVYFHLNQTKLANENISYEYASYYQWLKNNIFEKE